MNMEKGPAESVNNQTLLATEYLDGLEKELIDKNFAKEVGDIKKLIFPESDLTSEQIGDVSKLLQELVLVDHPVDLLTKKLLIAMRINQFGMENRLKKMEKEKSGL